MFLAYSGNTTNLLRAAVFLDQRFKDLDSFVPESDRKDVKEAVKLQMLELTVADEQTDETQSQSEAETNAQSSKSEQDPAPTC